VKLDRFPKLREPGDPGTDRRFAAVNCKLRYTGAA
jgi:hypothetical protein